MGHPKTWRIRSAANARAAKNKISFPLPSFAAEEETEVEVLEDTIMDLTGIPSESEETRWSGGVEHVQETDNSDFSWATDSDMDEWDSESGAEEDIEEDSELTNRLHRNIKHELQLLNSSQHSALDVIMEKHTAEDWKKAEHLSHRAFGYNGNSAHSVRRREKDARDKEIEDAKLRKT